MTLLPVFTGSIHANYDELFRATGYSTKEYTKFQGRPQEISQGGC
jgi:hypothetical protein